MPVINSPSDAGLDAPLMDASPRLDATVWRSSLYSDEWSPQQTRGPRFLHDFSYAGYANGQRQPEALDARFDVHDFDAHPSRDDNTAAFQAAIDAASDAGGVVWIPAGTYRLADTLTITGSHVVLRGEGPTRSKLRFTNLVGMAGRAHLRVHGRVTHDGEALLVENAGVGHRVVVDDTTAFEVGDQVDVGWVISPQFVEEHGMSGTWQVFNDTWQPFFRRTVTSIEGDTITLDVPLRYPAKTRDFASVRRSHGWIREVGIESLGFRNAGNEDDAWAESQSHLIELSGVIDAWVDGVATFGDDEHVASGGLLIRDSKRVTVSNSAMGPAQNRGPGGNGYLFEVRTSSEILYRDCVARGGRHNFITNWGFGTSGVVWLRVHSRDGEALSSRDGFRTLGVSDFHHSLATANLVDSSVIDDGWSARNRLTYSSGAGHSATECVFWNTSGRGTLRSYQWGHGYVIGTSPQLEVSTQDPLPDETPEDWAEGIGRGALLAPSSLYEDQLERRLSR